MRSRAPLFDAEPGRGGHDRSAPRPRHCKPAAGWMARRRSAVQRVPAGVGGVQLGLQPGQRGIGLLLGRAVLAVERRILQRGGARGDLGFQLLDPARQLLQLALVLVAQLLARGGLRGGNGWRRRRRGRGRGRRPGRRRGGLKAKIEELENKASTLFGLDKTKVENEILEVMQKIESINSEFDKNMSELS